MSAAVPRGPASTAAVARHYLRLLANVRTAAAFAIAAVVAFLGGMNSIAFEAYPSALWLMALMPTLHWGPAGMAFPLDQAMPADRARHDLARTVAGAAWAAAALAAAIAPVALLQYSAHHGRPGAGFWWYPPLLLAAGVAWYVVGMAAWLRKGSFTVLYFSACAAATLRLVIPGLERMDGLLSLRDAPAPGEPLVWMGWMLVTLVAVAGIAWLSAIAPRGESRIAAALRLRAARWSRGSAVLRRRATHGGVPDGPRRPAPFPITVWREIVLLRPLVSAAAVLLIALWLGSTATENRRGTMVAAVAWLLPLFWPMIVWRVGMSPRLSRVQPLPAGDVARQMARLAAGAVVLLFALLPVLTVCPALWANAADLALTQEGIAFLAAALLMYLLVSLPAIAAGEGRGGWTTGWLFFLLFVAIPFIRFKVSRGPFSLGSALAAVLGETNPPATAIVLWTVIFTALAAGLAIAGVDAERHSLVPPRGDAAPSPAPSPSPGPA